ncbi:hypothetical protein M9H77_01833 [Catharanthus roseus]|uniref:Uncharacterized protein n=1 Tax=Catharanthus roseus TaxID=4058 RepID=A0ACC0C735_CATRO|nr:hypothetical protein M9H77_01833 [Catharanthus roseus]
MSVSYLIPKSESHLRRRCSKHGFRMRCLTMIKQQKTRCYILRRCVTMLLCWRDYAVRD